MFLFVHKIFLIITIFFGSSFEKFYDKIYQNIDNVAICPKLLNETATVGCDGNVFPKMGILVDNFTDRQIDYVHQHQITYKLVPIYYASNLKSLKKFLTRLHKIANKIAGVLVLRAEQSDSSQVAALSDNVACPNERLLNSSQFYRWVDTPDQEIGLFFAHWPFPIFFVHHDEPISNIHNCISKWNDKMFDNNPTSINFNSKWFEPYCAAEIYSPSYAPNVKFDLKLCLKRKDRFFTMDETSYCDYIYSQNILVPIVPMLNKQSYAERSWLILAARLDSLSLYTGESPGADSVYTALVTLLAIVYTLSQHQEKLKVSQKQILFAFYGGEPLDIIGSSYHAFRIFNNTVLQNNSCKDNPFPRSCSGIDKISLKNIGHFIELNQLASYGKHSSIWLHTSQINSTQKLFLKLLQEQVVNVSDLSVNIANFDLPFPPSSVYSFVQLDASIEAIVGSNHQGSFANRFYHSTFDDISNLFSQQNELNLTERIRKEAKHLTRISTWISRAAVRFLVDDLPTNSVETDSLYVYTLLNCIFIDNNCSLLKLIRPSEPNFYDQSNFNDTHVMSTGNVLTELVYDLMTYMTAKNVTCPHGNATSEKSLEDEAYFYNKHDGYCMRHQVFREDVMSPHFFPASGRFSQWVSSHQPSVLLVSPLRLFLLQSTFYDYLICFIGLAFILITTLATIILSNYVLL